MTHKPIKFATFKALRNESVLSPPPDGRGENCVNFGVTKSSHGRRITPVICVNFERYNCETKDAGWCSALDAEPRVAAAPVCSGLRIKCGAQKLEAGEKHSVNCVNFGTGDIMHQVQL